MNKIFFVDFIAVEGFSVHLIMKAIILLIQQQSSACSFPLLQEMMNKRSNFKNFSHSLFLLEK